MLNEVILDDAHFCNVSLIFSRVDYKHCTMYRFAEVINGEFNFICEHPVMDVIYERYEANVKIQKEKW